MAAELSTPRAKRGLLAIRIERKHNIDGFAEGLPASSRRLLKSMRERVDRAHDLIRVCREKRNEAVRRPKRTGGRVPSGMCSFSEKLTNADVWHNPLKAHSFLGTGPPRAR
jgi:hypothetical protein